MHFSDAIENFFIIILSSLKGEKQIQFLSLVLKVNKIKADVDVEQKF